jgi:hypothetical protein
MTKKHVHHGGAAATHRHGGLPLQVPRDRDPLIARGAGDALVWMAEEAAAVAAPPWVQSGPRPPRPATSLGRSASTRCAGGS